MISEQLRASSVLQNMNWNANWMLKPFFLGYTNCKYSFYSPLKITKMSGAPFSHAPLALQVCFLVISFVISPPFVDCVAKIFCDSIRQEHGGDITFYLQCMWKAQNFGFLIRRYWLNSTLKRMWKPIMTHGDVKDTSSNISTQLKFLTLYCEWSKFYLGRPHSHFPLQLSDHPHIVRLICNHHAPHSVIDYTINSFWK